MSWTKVRIGDLVQPISKWNPKKNPTAPSFTYIDLSSIDKEMKEIVEVSIVNPMDAPSRARQLVRENDVLVSTVRPNLNGVSMIKSEHNGATASTGYCVLRPDTEKVHPSFLFHWVRTPYFISEMTRNSTGANYPAVSDTIIKEHVIDLPAMDEQRRVAEILDKVDTINQQIVQSQMRKKSAQVSLFLELFGDPVANNRNWKLCKLSELTSEIRSGNTPTGGSKNYVDEGIHFFRSQNVWRNDIVYADVAHIDEKTHSKMGKTSLKHNDILMTKTGRINTENSSLGRAALFKGKDDSANINGHIYLIRLNSQIVIHEFVVFILTMDVFRDYIRSVCVGGIDKRQLNKDHIENFPIICPPVELQKKFIHLLEVLSSDFTDCRLESSRTLYAATSQEILK